MSYVLIRVGRVWHYRFQVAGRRVQRSTHETVKGKAEEIAEKAYRLERMASRGEEPVPTLAQLAQKWIAANRSTASKGHIRALEIFARLHLYDLSGVKIDRIRVEAVEVARDRHLASHAPASVNHWLRNLRLLFHWAVQRGFIDAIPWKLRSLKLQKKPRVILPTPTAAAWLIAVDVAAGARKGIGTAVRLMLGLGLRESEALSARWEWIDWERSVYTPGLTKGREAQPLPVVGWLKEYLAASKAPEGLIVRSPTGKPFTPGYTGRVMKKANAVCGTPGVTPHRLRGTYATLLSESGVPVQDIKRLMRHKDLLTTLGYLELDHGRAVTGLEEIAKRMGFTARVLPVIQP